jgi:hypothetical protein
MKKILLTMVLGMFGMLAQQANAQIVCFVTEPLAVRGNYGIGIPASGWGFDIDTILVTGQLVVARSAGGVAAGDSLGCDTVIANASAVAGKIAVLYRGACEFGVKALAAQNAGAIGVVVINNAAGTINLGGGGVGPQVTIPTVMISDSDGAALRPFIDDDSTVAVIGNKAGFFGNDIGMTLADLIRPMEWAIPAHQVVNAGDYTAILGAEVVNYGQNARTNVELNIQVEFDDMSGSTPSVVYNQTATAATLASGDTAVLTTTPFDPAQYGKGKYSIKYIVSGNGTEDFDADNDVTTEFHITDSIYSKGRLDTIPHPIATGGIRPAIASGVTWEMGNAFYTGPRGNHAVVTKAYWQAVANAAFSLANETFAFFVYAWDDLDGNFVPSVAEVNVIGEGFYTYTANDGYIVKEADILDINTGQVGVRLDSNAKYIFALAYTGSQEETFVGTDNQVLYQPTRIANQRSIEPFFVGSEWGVGFASGSIGNYRIDMITSTVDVQEVVSDLKMKMYPNPAHEEINVRLSSDGLIGNVNYEIRDISGRAVKRGVHQVDADGLIFKADLSGLDAGMYFMHVSSNRGSNTMKFIVK